MAVVLGIVLCSVVDTDRGFKTAYLLMMQALSSSETSGSTFQTIRRYILEDSHVHIRRCENQKYNFVWKVL
jgi:hypothetical protein